MFGWPWLEHWEFPSGGGGGDPRTAACSSEGVLLVETRLDVNFRLLVGDSAVPPAPPLMWVWRDPHSAGATPSTVSAPSEHDAPPALDLGATSPSTSVATSCKAGCGLTQVGNGLYSPLSGGGGKKVLKAAKHRKGCF